MASMRFIPIDTGAPQQMCFTMHVADSPAQACIIRASPVSRACRPRAIAASAVAS